MPNPLRPGETIPIKQWTADQSAVQDTKYGPNAAQAGADYLNPKALAKSMTPVAQPAAKKSAIASVPNPHLPQSGWGAATGLASRLIPNAVNSATNAANQMYGAATKHIIDPTKPLPGVSGTPLETPANDPTNYSSLFNPPSAASTASNPAVAPLGTSKKWTSPPLRTGGNFKSSASSLTKKPLNAESAKRFQSIARGGAI